MGTKTLIMLGLVVLALTCAAYASGETPAIGSSSLSAALRAMDKNAQNTIGQLGSKVSSQTCSQIATITRAIQTAESSFSSLRKVPRPGFRQELLTFARSPGAFAQTSRLFGLFPAHVCPEGQVPTVRSPTEEIDATPWRMLFAST